MSVFQSMGWHEGEEAIHKKLGGPERDNPTIPTLSAQAISMLQRAPLIAIGTLDSESRPWTSVAGGEQGLSQPLASNVIGIRAPVPALHDPVVEALLGKHAIGDVVREEGDGRMVGAMAIDLETRKRVKLCGRMVAGALGGNTDESTSEDVSGEAGQASMQLVVRIDQSLGNCPKYLNQKIIIPAQATPRLVSNSTHLPQEAIALLEKSDLFFISSSHSMFDMDTNHRGGAPGFVRVLSNTKDSTVLVYPEYSGNRLYQTLGNLLTTPVAGLCFPDFETGDCLYVTGSTEILFGQEAAALLQRSNLAVKLTVTAARFVASVLPFRGRPGELSPYNPQVRYLATEQAPVNAQASSPNTAKLLSQTVLTPTISRFCFALSNSSTYSAGQYVTLDASRDLDIGYSHMRDDDPRSLNDDFVRTFTVSNPPSSTPKPTSNLADDEFEITIRRVGVVTDHFFKHGLPGPRRPALEVDVKGFGGSFEVRQKNEDEVVAFVAAGVGITPLLPCLPHLDGRRLSLLWALKREDLGLAVDVLRSNEALWRSTTLFITGKSNDQEREEEHLIWIRQAGVEIRKRRIERADMETLKSTIERFFVCTGTQQRSQLLEWLEGKEVLYEDYNF